MFGLLANDTSIEMTGILLNVEYDTSIYTGGYNYACTINFIGVNVTLYFANNEIGRFIHDMFKSGLSGQNILCTIKSNFTEEDEVFFIHEFNLSYPYQFDTPLDY